MSNNIDINAPVIFLDIDGVLADFFSGSVCMLGLDPQELLKKLPAGCWNYNRFIGIPDSDFYGQIDKAGASFWINLPIFPDAKKLYDICRIGAKTIFLSHPQPEPSSAAGKVEWIQRFVGSKLFSDFILTKHKRYFAKPNHLLIDDSDDNIDMFQKYGGSTILYPRKWNRRYAEVDSSFELVTNELQLWLKERRTHAD